MPYVGRQPTPSPVTADDIPANSIDASKLVDGSVTASDLGANSVGTSELIADAVTETEIADATVVNLKSGRKNLIINGGFDVWQRGTSFSSAEYTSDRWKAQIQASTGTHTQDSDAPSGFRYSLKETCTGTSSWFQVGQAVEYKNFAHLVGQEVTLSFYAKASFTGLTSRVRKATTEDANTIFSGTTVVAPAHILTTSWARYTTTFTIPTDAKALTLEFSETGWSNGDTFNITGVQLELGSQATDFEREDYGTTLSRCQRYYEISPTSYLSTYGSNSVSNIPYKVKKRTTPTSSVLEASTSGITAGTSDSAGNYLYKSGVVACSARLIADAEL